MGMNSQMDIRDRPHTGEVWRHFKNKEYEIITIARHVDTEEEYVVYRPLYAPEQDYIRTLTVFMSEVDFAKNPNSCQHYRFERVR